MLGNNGSLFNIGTYGLHTRVHVEATPFIAAPDKISKELLGSLHDLLCGGKRVESYHLKTDPIVRYFVTNKTGIHGNILLSAPISLVVRQNLAA